MHKKYLIIIIAALGLSGCSSIVNQSVAFRAEDFKRYDSPGTSTIYGHAFVHTRDGLKHNAGGLKVYLVPLNAYTDERARISLKRNEPGPADPGLEKYIRTEVADIQGLYEFHGLPAGDYMVYCRVVWDRFNLKRPSSGDYFIVARTGLKEGEKKHVVVTNDAD
ncbi:MAG TPA: hypothetical protein VGM64_15530 [Lacunisphaera sp.]